MKMLKIALVLAISLTPVFSALDTTHTLNSDWELFKKEYRKSYISIDEESHRRDIWESNLKYINNHNADEKSGKFSFTLRMNKFGDLTSLEFRKIYNGFNKTKNMNKPEGGFLFQRPMDWPMPQLVDLRQDGLVTGVKDQGTCAACWAFAAISAYEGQYFREAQYSSKENKLTAFSEQDLIDCSRSFGNLGCDGGLMDQAFEYVKSNGQIQTQDEYPYKASNQKCNVDVVNKPEEFVYRYISPGDEGELASAIALFGPVSVAIDASQRSFQFYSSGIYSDPDCSSTELDRGMAAVGYGSLEKGKEYYIVKNSLGMDWGEEGYINIARNKNMCGIAMAASFPIL